MTDESKNPDVRIPEGKQAVIEMVEEDEGRELTEQEKNVAIAQAKVIGDL